MTTINNIVIKITEIEALSFYRRCDVNMGRAGSGGGRSSSSSGGGHSTGRTGGGHQVNSGGTSVPGKRQRKIKDS